MYEIFEQLLKEHAVTAYKVAKATGITTATLTSWKQGKYTPKNEKLQKIADFFNVSIDYLLGREQDDYLTSNQENAVKSLKKEQIIKQLADIMEDMTEEDLQFSLEMLERLSKK